MDVKPKRVERTENTKRLSRQRKRPVRKWKNSEINDLINYLIRNKRFEKPTQRIYYLDFIHQYEIDIPWDLVKSTVRNLRIKYEKLRNLYMSCDQGANRIKTLRLIERSCPHFHKLGVIFGNRKVPVKKSKQEKPQQAITSSQNEINDIEGTSIDSSDVNSSYTTEISYDPRLNIAPSPISSVQQMNINVTENYLKENITVPLPIRSSIKEELVWMTDTSVKHNQSDDQHQLAVTESMNNIDVVNDITDASLNQANLTDTATIPNHLQISNLAENPIRDNSVSSELNDNDGLEILKFHFEQDKFFRCMALKEKKFQFKMEMKRKQFQLRTMKMELEKMKVEKDLELDKMRLEIDERVTLKKLEIQQNDNN